MSLIWRFISIRFGFPTVVAIQFLFLWGGLATAAPIVLSGLKVFPGAQGFGTETPAGRGGQIIKVTTLKDKGTGSLRAAIEVEGPRIIVFEVGGTINLSDDLYIKHPNVTIAGQTAPSPGIILKGAGLIVETHDVLVQHLQIRTGDLPIGPSPADNRDGLAIHGWYPNINNIVIDHVSVSWATDENFGPYHRDYGIKNITISNSILSESLKFGILIGGGVENISLIRNLMAHNMDRNPLVKSGASVEIINNLIYNSSENEFTSIGANDEKYGPAFVNLLGNVYIQGPDTAFYVNAIKVERSAAPGTKVYLDDNLFSGRLFVSGCPFEPRVDTPALDMSASVVLPSRVVEKWVLQNAGSRPAERDPVDLRVVNSVKTRSGKLIRSQSEVGGWPLSVSSFRPFPIPLNPNGDDDNNGYTNIEEVLHLEATRVERGN